MSSTTVGVLVIAGAFILLSITGDRRYSLTRNLGVLGLILLLGLAAPIRKVQLKLKDLDAAG